MATLTHNEKLLLRLAGWREARGDGLKAVTAVIMVLFHRAGHVAPGVTGGGVTKTGVGVSQALRAMIIHMVGGFSVSVDSTDTLFPRKVSKYVKPYLQYEHRTNGCHNK